MSKESVGYERDGCTADLVVHRATVRMGIRRTMLSREARGYEDEDRGVALLRVFTWPDLMSCTTGEINGQPLEALSFEEWLELPERLAISWEKAVYALNPHWAGRDDDSGEG